jgi:sulfide dehydrogenase cytochrome subunit
MSSPPATPAMLRDKKRPLASLCASGARRMVGLAITASVILLVTHAGSAAGGDPGAQLAATCTSCHRLNGHDQGIPSIAGQDEETLTRAMLGYKSGERPSHIMQAVTLSLSAEEIRAAARYFAAQGKKAKQP